MHKQCRKEGGGGGGIKIPSNRSNKKGKRLQLNKIEVVEE